MMTTKTALKQIKELQEQIKALSADAVATLKGEKQNLLNRVVEIDWEIEDLTGEKAERPRAAGTRKSRARVDWSATLKRPSLQELKEILRGLPNKTLSVRKEGYDTGNIRTIVDANPGLFRYQRSAFPQLTLLK